jgi:hypothetical protein
VDFYHAALKMLAATSLKLPAHVPTHRCRRKQATIGGEEIELSLEPLPRLLLLPVAGPGRFSFSLSLSPPSCSSRASESLFLLAQWPPLFPPPNSWPAPGRAPAACIFGQPLPESGPPTLPSIDPASGSYPPEAPPLRSTLLHITPLLGVTSISSS